MIQVRNDTRKSQSDMADMQQCKNSLCILSRMSSSLLSKTILIAIESFDAELGTLKDEVSEIKTSKHFLMDFLKNLDKIISLN
jgi:hypothetical protein